MIKRVNIISLLKKMSVLLKNKEYHFFSISKSTNKNNTGKLYWSNS